MEREETWDGCGQGSETVLEGNEMVRVGPMVRVGQMMRKMAGWRG